jgi:hypothetical protein
MPRPWGLTPLMYTLRILPVPTFFPNLPATDVNITTRSGAWPGSLAYDQTALYSDKVQHKFLLQ